MTNRKEPILENSRECELIEMVRRSAAINAGLAEALSAILRILAQDTLWMADLAAPDDAREARLVRDIRQRAQRIVAGLGVDDHAAH
jgi:hypothetical protein